MGWTAFNRYKDMWVLCPKAKVLGGAPIDVGPVILLDALQAAELEITVRRLLAEELPDVQPPDLNAPENVLGLRAQAVGAKSWRAFNAVSRTFVLREENDQLVLEEWPKDAGRPAWKKKFGAGAVGDVVKHVVRLTAPTERTRIRRLR